MTTSMQDTPPLPPTPPVPVLDPPTITADDLRHETGLHWLDPASVDALPWVRQAIILAPSADGPLLWPTERAYGLLGWSVVTEDGPLLGPIEIAGCRWGWRRRRVFFSLPQADPSGGIGLALGRWPGAPAYVDWPGSVVDPRTVAPGQLGTVTARAVIGNRGELAEGTTLQAAGDDGSRDGETGGTD